MPFKLKTKMPKVLLPFFVAAIAPLSLPFSTYANSDVDFGVTIPETPLLEVTLLDPDSAAANGPIIIDATLSKGATGFNEKDVTINISTSNTWGYNLVMSVSNTALTSSNNNTIANLTQKSGGYTCTADTAANCDFTVNSWGFKIKSNTSTQNATNYIPVPETITLAHSTTAASSEQAQIAFGSRINTSQAPGNYSTTINFLATANPDPTPIMQNITNAELATLLPNTGDTTTLKDSRDGKRYNVSKIGDNYWMTTNLDLTGDTTLTSADSNVAANYTLPASSTSGFSDDATAAYVYNSNSTTCGNGSPCYSYYSYAAATAGTNPSSGEATSDICPKGWRLPTNAEYTALKNTYTTGATLTAAPFYGVYAGDYHDSSFRNGGSYGNYWSSTTDNAFAAAANLLYFNSSSANTGRSSKELGYSIRCIKGTTMQEVTAAQLNSWLPNTGDTITLKDYRDGNSYTVSKLDDGNYWMTQTLRLGKGNGEIIALNSANSDLPAGRTFNLKASGMGSNQPNASGDCNVGNWRPDTTAEYYDVSHLCINTNDVETYGVYYNWYTATAGTGTYDAGANGEDEDAIGSICPKGWRLPPNGGNKSYYNLLVTTLHLTSSTAYATMQNPPYNFPLSGNTYGEGIGSVGYFGYFWSSTAYDEETAYRLIFGSSDLNPQVDVDKGYGYSVRCVFRS